MKNIKKFNPIIAMCHQGQRRSGVDEGGLYVYQNVFRDICESKPYVVQNGQFLSQDGYQKLYGLCKGMNKPLTIGGDHSVASSSTLASLQNFKDLHVIWIDAHPDIHTYTSSVSGNTHGTPLSVCTGLEKTHWASRISLELLPFDRLIYVGIRDIDDFEAEIIEKHKIKCYTPAMAIDFIKNNTKTPIHISFDVDSLDPSYVSSTGTRVDQGLHPQEARDIIESALEIDTLKSLDVVEFNPILGDPEHSIKAIQEVFRM